MIIIVKNTPEHIIFEKDDEREPWFNHDCSDENLLKHCDRVGDTIKTIKWDDGKYIASLLHIYFKLT